MIGVLTFFGMVSLGTLMGHSLLKALVDLDTVSVCNKRNKDINPSSHCNRYLILAHYNNTKMTQIFSFSGLTKYTPPRWRVVEHPLSFNDIEYKKAVIKPQPWCYDVVDSSIKIIKDSFRISLKKDPSNIQYDLYLLSGPNTEFPYERKIVNGTEQDIMNYDFSQDM